MNKFIFITSGLVIAYWAFKKKNWWVIIIDIALIFLFAKDWSGLSYIIS